MDKNAPLGLKIIAGAKIIKGVILSGLSLGVFDSIHKDVGAMARHFVEIARISPENRYVEIVLEKLGVIDSKTLVHIGLLSALYASILLIEGLSLWFGASWSEYLVVISTGIFVPEECLAAIHHFTWFRIAILAVNSAMLAYVANLVWHRFSERRLRRGAERPA